MQVRQQELQKQSAAVAYEEVPVLAKPDIAEKKPRRVKDPNAPKKPLSAFFIYLKKRRMEETGTPDTKVNITDFSSRIGREWNTMSDEDKQRYRFDRDLGMEVLKKAEQTSQESKSPKPEPEQQAASFGLTEAV